MQCEDSERVSRARRRGGEEGEREAHACARQTERLTCTTTRRVSETSMTIDTPLTTSSNGCAHFELFIHSANKLPQYDRASMSIDAQSAMSALLPTVRAAMNWMDVIVVKRTIERISTTTFPVHRSPQRALPPHIVFVHRLSTPSSVKTICDATVEIDRARELSCSPLRVAEFHVSYSEFHNDSPPPSESYSAISSLDESRSIIFLLD